MTRARLAVGFVCVALAGCSVCTGLPRPPDCEYTGDIVDGARTKLLVHRRVGLVDFTGHGWTTLEAYARSADGGEVALHRVEVELDSVVDRLWPGAAGGDGRACRALEPRLALAVVRWVGEARDIYIQEYVAPVTSEYGMLEAAVRQALGRASVGIDGSTRPLGPLLLDYRNPRRGPGAPVGVAYIAAPADARTLTVSDGLRSKSLALPEESAPHERIRCRGRVFGDAAGVVLLDPRNIEATTYRSVCGLGAHRWCLHFCGRGPWPE